MTTLLIVRHGQSKANKEDVFLGHGDLELTELGHEQAQKTANYLKNVHIDHIYSSDLLRAYQTAEHTAKEKNLPIIKSENLREIYGGKWEYVSFKDILRDYPKEFATWAENVGRAYCPGGETVIEVQERVFKEINKIAEENPNKTVAIFSHATAIQQMICAINKVDIDDIKNVAYPSNASVTKIEYKDGKFTVVEYGKDDFMGEIRTALPFKEKEQ